MKEIIEIKRKEFTIVEKIGDRSFLVERKGQNFVLKQFGDAIGDFEDFCDAEHRLRVSGVTNPKCYLYDKKTRMAVIEYIEGENCLDKLLTGELPDTIIELLFKTFWYAKNDGISLDYHPDNFVFANGKLYYLPFKTGKFVNNDSFVQQDIRLWFYTKEFVQYCRSIGLDPSVEHLKSDYEINKAITLMIVKYYR